VGALLYFGLSAAGVHAAGLVVVAALFGLFVLVMIVVGLIVQVPALTFVRYYSLSVLGMLAPELDLVGVERPDGDDDGDSGPAENGDDADDDDGDSGPAENGDDADDDGDDTHRTRGYRSSSCRRSVVSISG